MMTVGFLRQFVFPTSKDRRADTHQYRETPHLDRYAKAVPWATVRKLAQGGHQMGNDLSAVAQDIAAIKQGDGDGDGDSEDL